MSAWNLFPFPTLFAGTSPEKAPTFEDGSLIATPKECASCPTRECQSDKSAPSGEIRECRYGMNYARIDDRRLIVGVVAPELPHASRRLKKRGRQNSELRVRPKQVTEAIKRATALGPGVVADFEREKQTILDGLKDSPEMFKALAQQLRSDFQETLGQSHDLLQLVKLVRGYTEVLLQEACPGLSNEDAAEKLPTEGAIYFACELMLAKMDALVFLHEINLVHGGETSFQIHPLVVKYVRIYGWQAQQKNLDLQWFGSAHGRCRYNSQAIGSVVQGMLDNLVKYSPAGSKATINFEEKSGQVTVSFTSLGPRIEDDELQRIFLPGVRARAAKGMASNGLGLGLATAKQVSDALDLKLGVDQNPVENCKYRERYMTTFSITLQLL
jgi:signal transduction histidine kinase